ncbi:hypothetical protein BJX63DRAFT_429828 [Aspergillus granulosus]|uniref:DUF6606 domain-containing protein n=1 Tax=Aspergillus granulosus TaxID=176169 RepID=A0ABR4HPM4_9EURO
MASRLCGLQWMAIDHSLTSHAAFMDIHQSRLYLIQSPTTRAEYVAYSREQHPGILIRKSPEQNVIVEVFEVSPSVEQALVRGALQWGYPGAADLRQQ